jgi:hypothetical protein
MEVLTEWRRHMPTIAACPNVTLKAAALTSHKQHEGLAQRTAAQ